jgi:hypothetical protein
MAKASDKAARLRFRGSVIVHFANEKAAHLAQLGEYDPTRHHLRRSAEQLALFARPDQQLFLGYGLPLRLGSTSRVPHITDFPYRTSRQV